MPENIIQIDQNLLETRLDRLVAEKVAELLNAMLDAEADEIANAAKYERTGERKAYRAGHYDRSLTAKAGRLALKVPKLKGAVFESAVIERYRRREESVEEALIDMYLAGVSTRQVDDISQLLWGVYFVKLRWTCSALNLDTVGVQLEHRRRLVPCFVVCLVYFMRECLFR